MAKAKEPLLRKADFSSYLEERAREMAPRDVEALLSEDGAARARAAALSPRIGQQMALAMEMLADHHDGQSPQIPFYTISLLAEAVYYFLDPNDVIPDWIPEIGKLDDALVLELAFELGADGVRRYCAWKGIDDSMFYGAASASAEVIAAAAAAEARIDKPATSKRGSAAKKASKKASKARPKAKASAKKKQSRTR